MKHQFDVIVVGGGIVGLSAALVMQKNGCSVALIEAETLTANKTPRNSRVYAINQASQNLLAKLEVWEQLDKTKIAPYRRMYVWDAANGAHIDFDARLVGRDRLGTIAFEGVIKEALLQQASNNGIIFFPHSPVNFVESRHDEVVVSSDANSWHAKLLIVADGAKSATRHLLGVKTTNWPYHQHAVVATVATEKPHQDTAYQVFNEDGPLAFLPLSSATECSIVWSTTPCKAKVLQDASEEDFNQQLTAAFAASLGGCRVISARHQFPLYMCHTHQYCGSNWILMGDAAHNIHPLAGLGLNVGLADVAQWGKIINASKEKLWSAKALGEYQRHRKHTVWQVIMLLEALKAVFANPLPPVVSLRGLGLGLCNGIPLLKRFFIEQAAGV